MFAEQSVADFLAEMSGLERVPGDAVHVYAGILIRTFPDDASFRASHPDASRPVRDKHGIPEDD